MQGSSSCQQNLEAKTNTEYQACLEQIIKALS